MDPNRHYPHFSLPPSASDHGQRQEHQPSTPRQRSVESSMALDPTGASLLADWDPSTFLVPATLDSGAPHLTRSMLQAQSWPQNPVFPSDQSETVIPDLVQSSMSSAIEIPPLLHSTDDFFVQQDPFASVDPNFLEAGSPSIPWEGLFGNDFLQSQSPNFPPLNNRGPFEPGQISSGLDRDAVFSDATTLVAAEGDKYDQSLRRTSSLQGGSEFSTEEERWNAVLSRSRAADRYFLYGVVTTKVFCRPSCASRRAGRQHIQFFPFPGAIDAGLAAGFRACKRCVPDQLGVADKGVNGAVKALRLIINDAFEPKEDRAKVAALKLEDLAKEADLSPFHFQRVFKATTQMTPGDFSTACQSLALQDALAKQMPAASTKTVATTNVAEMDVDEILQKFSRWSIRTAKKALGGVTPSDYANGLPKLQVQHISSDCPAGRVCIAYTSKFAVHAVLVDNNAEALVQARFIRAMQSSNCLSKLQHKINILQEEAKDRDSELPDDVLTTLWRARVWLKILRDSLLGDGA